MHNAAGPVRVVSTREIHEDVDHKSVFPSIVIFARLPEKFSWAKPRSQTNGVKGNARVESSGERDR
jgi:hypothetical protein